MTMFCHIRFSDQGQHFAIILEGYVYKWITIGIIALLFKVSGNYLKTKIDISNTNVTGKRMAPMVLRSRALDTSPGQSNPVSMGAQPKALANRAKVTAMSYSRKCLLLIMLVVMPMMVHFNSQIRQMAA